MDLGISGRNALVTGGSRGLGRQCALSLASEGVNVAICGRTRSTIDRTVAELEDMGVKALGVVADVMQIDDIPRLYDETVNGLGPPDILVNNAGGSAGATDLSDTPLENYRQLFDFNLFSGYELSRLALPHMQRAGLGTDHQHRLDLRTGARWEHRVHVRQGRGDRRDEARGAFARGQRRDGQLDRAWLDTARRRKLGAVPARAAAGGRGKFIETNLPMGRFGWPEPVGDLCAFLASDRADLITGSCIVVDGGQSHSLI